MYEELVKKLRHCNDEVFCNKCEWTWNCGGEKMIIGEAADAIEDLSKTLDEEVEINTAMGCNMPVWIPVAERLPERNYNCLVCDDGVVLEGYMNLVGGWYDLIGDKLKYVTHWMPLPTPPKDGAE